jgi:FdrA protein
VSAVHVEVRPGAYADSVALLGVSRVLQDVPGVAAGQVAMATALNVDVLTTMGFTVPDGTGPNDLVVAVRLAPDAGDGTLEQALAAVEEALRAPARRTSEAAEAPPRTTASALRVDPGALVLVSVPGASAFVEAVDALEAGSDVMVFSDNVPVAQEVALKRLAAERDLLVMGPDCGTAVVGGVGLGFANAVAPGPVGIVAASGTGCQQLLALLDHAGVGISHALGVGGRDLSAEVGGAATREALRRLDADPATEVVVLVSKPPAEEVAAALASYVGELATPVGSGLLGPGRRDLTAVAEATLAQLGRPVPAWPVAGRSRPGRGGRLHGLFVGGTLCTEARLVAEALGVEGSFTDFGDDEYTRGRAHPMIDPTLRLERLAAVGSLPETGVVLLDVVLGHGAEPDPAARLAPAIRALDQPVVVTVVGTSRDPQGRDRQVAALVEAGAEVHLSNARAARRAVQLAGAPGGAA